MVGALELRHDQTVRAQVEGVEQAESRSELSAGGQRARMQRPEMIQVPPSVGERNRDALRTHLLDAEPVRPVERDQPAENSAQSPSIAFPCPVQGPTECPFQRCL